jgi:aromatic ring-opening dioxygenase catalytic subunit (LigB family)
MKSQSGKGALGRFLSMFGPTLLEKYKPKGIVVFSAHWEEAGEVLGELAVCLIRNTVIY